MKVHREVIRLNMKETAYEQVVSFLASFLLIL